MKKNSNKKSDERTNPLKSYFNMVSAYIKHKYAFLILFFLGFLSVSLLNFLNVSTTDSVANFALEDFEIGQIADRTIIADRNLAPDGNDPVAIEKGEKIIKKGFPISEENYSKLKKMSSSPVYIDYRAFANKELYLFLIAILWYLLLSFSPRANSLKLKEPLMEFIFILITYTAVVFGSKVAFFANPYGITTIIPSALFVILITILFGHTSSVIFSAILSLVILAATNWEIVPFLYTIATSMCACAIVRKIERRIDLMFASIILAVANIVFIIVLFVTFNNSFVSKGFIFLGIVCNGFLSGILALGLLTPLEFILNTASTFRLMDLSDLNNSLMRKMSITASGTYQHSIMVAQLAESACRQIGANALLARVAGYYHDIGKMDQSEYFTENQQGENKHDDINPSLSFTVIKSHVKKGVEKAHQLHLPQAVIDIISEHHGNSTVVYFYNKAKELDASVSPEDFSYPGNPPSTRESAVVMLADTVEAACKSLKNPSVPQLEKFITTLISEKIQADQMDDCDLTFRDISRIKEAFLQILAGYYHSRIEYPGQQEKLNEEQKSAEVQKAEEKKDEKQKSEK